MKLLHGMFFKDSQLAFNQAISRGYLTISPKDDNYAGNYMYMHSEPKGDEFKHCITRRYLYVPALYGDEVNNIIPDCL